MATFDPTKNYAEFGNAFFRGRLKGATGVARFKLTARSVNAVDTINIAGQAVTYDWITVFPAKTAPNDTDKVLYQTVVEIVDDGVYLEILAYSSCKPAALGGKQAVETYRTFWIDGVLQPNFRAKDCAYKMSPYQTVVPLARGTHVLQIRHNPFGGYAISRQYPDSGYSAEGYIFCRYIRRTGSDA